MHNFVTKAWEPCNQRTIEWQFLKHASFIKTKEDSFLIKKIVILQLSNDSFANKNWQFKNDVSATITDWNWCLINLCTLLYLTYC